MTTGGGATITTREMTTMRTTEGGEGTIMFEYSVSSGSLTVGGGVRGHMSFLALFLKTTHFVILKDEATDL